MVLAQNVSRLAGFSSDSAAGIAPLLVSIVTSVGASLLLWRLWRFTIAPSYRPNEPKQLPYWIPFVGHAVSFFQNSEGLLKYGRQFFGNTREVFALTVAGQCLYVVTSPRDIQSVYKNFGTLTFDGFVEDMYRGFGMSDKGIDNIFEEKPTEDGVNTQGGAFRHRAVMGANVPHEQLQVGSANFEDLAAVYKAAIEAQTKVTNIPTKAFVNDPPAGDGRRVVSLRNWTAEVLGRATMQAFFGPSLLQIDPGLLDAFRTFDSNSWMLTYQYPRAFARIMYDAMERGTRAFTRYYEQPEGKREGAAYWIRTVDRLQREKGMDTQDMAISGQLILWVVNANHAKVTFWLLAYILHHPDLLARIRAEIAPALSHGKLDLPCLTEDSPLLNATFHEVLRLTTAASSARNVEAPTTIGRTVLQPGAKLLVPYRQLHYADEFFPDATAFRPERFLENKKLDSAPYYRPFGGGITYCSGRFLARRQVLGLAAVVLLSYDTEVMGSKRLPRLDMTKPTLGTMDSLEGDDVFLAIKEK